MTTVLHALNNFLAAERDRGIVPDLLSRWHPGMETQVLVSSVGGWPVEERQGCFTNGMTSWWHIRVPKNANSEPDFNDYPLNWFLHEHADCIGSTGWDWQARRSRWVGFDFDALVGHAKGVGVADEELNAVKEKAQSLPYVEVRRSTGGAGLHLYVHVDVPTENHTVHSALARSILSMMSAETGFDFAKSIDCCGGNMWIWRRDLEPGGAGLVQLKAATHYLDESDLPANWRDHIAVVKKGGGKLATDESVAALSNAIKEVPLDEEHKALIASLGESGFTTIWNNDYHCLHTKTKALQDIFEAGGIKGVFRTVSEGNNPAEPNCYMFPMEGGAWRVYRFANAAEADTWTTDGAGRTTCYFNRRATLKSACLFYGGVEDPDTGEYVTTYEGALDTARCLGEFLSLPDEAKGREIRLSKSKDCRMVVKIKKETKETESIAGWINKGKAYCKVLKATIEDREESYHEFDEVFRKLISATGDDAGWMMLSEDGWISSTKDDVKSMLEAKGARKAEINSILGNSLLRPWKLVNLPFQEEYPGGRQWNLDSAQLAFAPIEGGAGHPTWDLVMNHCGADLDDYIAKLDWCREDRIYKGADYLRAWLACMFRFPLEPLPYLFFFGKQDSGKSTFHEAASLLMTKGFVRADKALTNKNDFNGELANAILCIVEEKNISTAAGAYAKIKDWVTSRTIAIRRMRTDTYMQPNSTHWVQSGNYRSDCAIAAGDTRIVMMHVRKPVKIIPWHDLRQLLIEEAPQFLLTLMSLELPTYRDRLRMPVIETSNKIAAVKKTANDVLQEFSDNCIVECPGSSIYLAQFKERLKECDPDHWELVKNTNTNHLADLTPPLFSKKSDKGQVILDVRWASPFALSV